MPVNKISFFGQSPTSVVANFLQNVGQANAVTTNGGVITLPMAAAQVILIPAGQWWVSAGLYTDVQFFDQVSQIWRTLTVLDSAPLQITSDGTNFRLANLTGCPVGAVVTTAGTTTGATTPISMYTSTGVWTAGAFTTTTPLVTCVPSAGGSTWNTFIGGAINTTITITAGGTGYTSAPRLVILPPAAQGAQPFIPATAVCTISAGVINAVTVTNQGAGYVAAPTVLILNAPGDTAGSNGVLTCALTGAGQVTAVTMATPGTALTATPTLTFAGSALPASAAASVLSNFTITNAGTGTVTAGTTYTNGYSLFATGGVSTATPVYTNPAIEKGIISPIQPTIFSASTTVQNLNSANTIFVNAGYGFQVAPLALTGVGLFATIGYITAPTIGGQNDISTIWAV